MTAVRVITSEAMLAHRNPPGHPERPARLEALLARVAVGDLPAECVEAAPIGRRHLERVHATQYLDRVESLEGRSAQLDPDTWIVPASLDAARRSAGAALQAVTHALSGSGPAFALGRPPGHHAERARAMGFCIYANVAVAVAAAIAEIGAQRVMVVDFDVHHGNGTQHAFEARNDVLLVDAHRGFGYWPGSGDGSEQGIGPGVGYTVNLPYRPGTDDRALLALLGAVVPDRASDFAPDLMVVSAGYDAHVADPLGGCAVTDDGFAAVTTMLRDVARDVCGGRIAFVLEGGYEPDATARCVAEAITLLSA